MYHKQDKKKKSWKVWEVDKKFNLLYLFHLFLDMFTMILVY